VKNIGGMTSCTTTLRYSWDKVNWKTISIDPLSPMESLTKDTDIKFFNDAGVYSLYVEVDDADNIPEFDEDNNNSSCNIKVDTRCAEFSLNRFNGKFFRDDIIVIHSNPSQGASVKLKLNIFNNGSASEVCRVLVEKVHFDGSVTQILNDYVKDAAGNRICIEHNSSELMEIADTVSSGDYFYRVTVNSDNAVKECFNRQYNVFQRTIADLWCR
jgi:hypothetical protein